MALVEWSQNRKHVFYVQNCRTNKIYKTRRKDIGVSAQSSFFLSILTNKLEGCILYPSV